MGELTALMPLLPSTVGRVAREKCPSEKKNKMFSDSLLVSQPWVIVSRLQECQEALCDLQYNGMGL